MVNKSYKKNENTNKKKTKQKKINKEQNNEPENNVYIISKFIYTIDIHCVHGNGSVEEEERKQKKKIVGRLS